MVLVLVSPSLFAFIFVRGHTYIHTRMCVYARLKITFSYNRSLLDEYKYKKEKEIRTNAMTVLEIKQDLMTPFYVAITEVIKS